MTAKEGQPGAMFPEIMFINRVRKLTPNQGFGN
jgi:hypothetical protein